MSSWIKYLVGFILLMHGLAHLGGLVESWLPGDRGFGQNTWLLPGSVTTRSWAGRLVSILWLLAAAGLVASGVGIFTGTSWWRISALAAACASLVIILLWWKVVPPGAKAGAVFDLLILGSLAPAWGQQVVQLISP